MLRVADLARLAGVPARTLGRLVHDGTGLTPKWLIGRRRLQAAATTLFTDPATDLALLAAELGYADQAHLTRRYRAVIGETPDATRRRSPAHPAHRGPGPDARAPGVSGTPRSP